MDITCTADLHGKFPDLPGGDLLIIAGDLTASDRMIQYISFFEWLYEQEYEKKVFISGNHDNHSMELFSWGSNTQYLLDSGTEFEGVKIWGSPWTLNFDGMNPKCKAFGLNTEKELLKKWNLIPRDTDILITHSPPLGILDKNKDGKLCGSPSLLKIVNKFRPKLMVFGHIHEQGGEYLDSKHTLYVNSSHVNERYFGVNDAFEAIL